MHQLICIGRDGVERKFYYKSSYDESVCEWNFKVVTDPLPSSGEFFELTVKEIGQDVVRVIAMYHHCEPAYMAAGIPDALLPIVRKVVGKSVCSSPTLGNGNVYRTPDATKVWERLKGRGIAVYKSDKDIYCIL